MCCTFGFTCKMAMVSNFFKKHFSSRYVTCCCVLVYFEVFFNNANIFFLSKLITFVALFLREPQNFFIKPSPRCKLCLFFIASKTHIVDIGYPQGTCSPIFVLTIFLVYLPIYLFNQRFKVSINNVWHFIWLHMLIKCNTLSF